MKKLLMVLLTLSSLHAIKNDNPIDVYEKLGMTAQFLGVFCCIAGASTSCGCPVAQAGCACCTAGILSRVKAEKIRQKLFLKTQPDQERMTG